MNVQKGRLLSGGRLQIPADVRKSLSLADGDTVLIEVVDGEIHLRPQRAAVSRIQARLREYISTDESVTDELIADRRAEAAGE
jgi:AbrB family looped-hinge helix DNA binding protein